MLDCHVSTRLSSNGQAFPRSCIWYRSGYQDIYRSCGAQVSYFKSSLDMQLLDLLWNKYWVNTLASSPLITTRDLATGQIRDIGAPHALAIFPHNPS